MDKILRKIHNIAFSMNRIDDFFESFDHETGNIDEIEQRLQLLEKNYENYEEFQSKLEDGIKDPEILKQQDVVRERMENVYFHAVGLGKAILKLSVKNVDAKKENVILQNVKLPTLRLPSFEGNYEEWLFFRDAFKANVHDNKAVSIIDKFQYLRTSLKGDALKTIESMELSEINYEAAWQLLNDRYNNKKAIVKKHIQMLFDVQTVNKESNVQIRQIIDNTLKNLRVLNNFDQPTDAWDQMIIFLIETKLDAVTRRDWENESKGKELPTLQEFIKFLEHRCQVLEAISAVNKVTLSSSITVPKSSSSSLVHKSNNYGHKSSSKQRGATSLATTFAIECYVCKGDHRIYHCEEFLKLSQDDRLQRVMSLKLCLNCLSHIHQTFKCIKRSCSYCKKRHNTLLHPVDNHHDSNVPASGVAQSSAMCQYVPDTNDQRMAIQHIHNNQQPCIISCNNQHPTLSSKNSTSDCAQRPSVNNQDIPSSSQAYNNYACSAQASRQIFLSTVLINVADANGVNHVGRALLDSGSQANFIRESFLKQLGLKGNNISIPINGINQLVTQVTNSVNITISSRHSKFARNLEFLVMPKITNDLPSTRVEVNTWNIPSTIHLADPYFNEPGRIDILLGAQVFFELLHVGQTILRDCLPMLQNTVFGWVVTGPCKNSASPEIMSCHSMVDVTNCQPDLQQQMSKFWDVEDFHSTNILQSFEEQQCEQFFAETTKRDSSGRFIVKLPFKNDPSCLGESRSIAEKRFYQLERRLTNNPKFRQMYTDFINEYIALDHMAQVSADQQSTFAVYLPHHGVIKESSSTTKLRVVFDASAKTSSGKSLNDVLMVDPKIQDDLIDIVMRFRTHEVVLTADVAKMYRQVNVDQSDHHYQRILWRDNKSEPLRHYNLKTVTYGTASAPYLATKCLQQVAVDEAFQFPRASQAVLHDFYVDDILTGTQTIEDAKILQRELSHLLDSGKFQLRKWSSNRNEVLSTIPLDDREIQNPLSFDSDETVGILGLKWMPAQDQFQFHVGSFSDIVTKRTILSDISKLFDPLGLVGPVIINAKILMQDIWKLQLNWDDPIPESINLKWTEYKQHILDINSIKINRCVITVSPPYTINIVGFSDASEHAYGATVYIVTTDTDGNTSSHLLCAKSRVAPLKRLTIPRLELCGALLLAELIEKVSLSIKINFSEIRAYTDSMIVLYWLLGDPCKQKTFVGNRIAQIKGILGSANWHHVKSEENPADLISRGVTAADLIDNSLWWHGPAWLEANIFDNVDNSIVDLKPDDLSAAQKEEKLIINVLTITTETKFIDNWMDLFTLSQVQRIVAYCLRVASIAKRTPNRQRGRALSVPELDNALDVIVKHVQQEQFAKEIQCLKQGQPLHSKSKLLSLNPFLDTKGVLRVGGRLAQADFRYETKYPALIPAKHRFTQLLFEQEHKRLLHIGPQALLANIRLKFWPIDGRNIAKKTTHQCLSCFTHRPEVRHQQMGHLPSTRITPTRPFLHCGVDYGGPIMTLLHKGRPSKTNTTVKSYIALFVCFSTKAIHIEVVSELSTNSFIAAFRRFIARRGKCISISSDNGTNFVGADREIQKMVNSTKHNQQMFKYLASENIQWKCLPPGSPHMGGIWEAGIKSTKHHIRRVTDKNTVYTFEELTTLTAQIEACLNSRPITPLSMDPSDYTALTPGHFLIGAPLVSIPDVDYTDIPDNRLKKFKLIQKQVQLFWKRWVSEYVTTLQNRTKWKTAQEDLKINDMVLVRDDNTPPLQWTLGRVVKLHPGIDKKIRVAIIKTPRGELCRNITKLCKLPINDSI